MTSGQVILQDSVHFLGLAAPLPMPPDYRSSIQILYVRHDTKWGGHSEQGRGDDPYGLPHGKIRSW